MSDIFTVVLDLSRVKNDEKRNNMYLAMADTTKMKMIYEFKLYIQFLFSLDCSVELFHEDVRLPDLEDIRVLSRLDVVQVRPLENIEEKKCKGMKLISKSKGYTEKHDDGDPGPMQGDNAANYNYIDSQENEAGKIVRDQEVSECDAHEKFDRLCGSSFPASDRICNSVQKLNYNCIKKVCDMQEKTFRLGEKTGMAENLKLGTLLQNRYYGWRGTDSNIVTGRSHFQKNNEPPYTKSGEKPYLSESSEKFYDVCGGVEIKQCISNELELGDVNISKNTFKGTVWSPVMLEETKDHEFCEREHTAYENGSKSCSTSIPDPHASSCCSHVIPGTGQKPLTSLAANSSEKKFSAKGNFGRKPLSVDEALKILTEAAAERSKTLSGHNPASHNEGKKNQFKVVCKAFKTTPAGGSRNFQNNNFKHQTTSKNPGTLDQDGMAQTVLDGHNTKVAKFQCQIHVPKQELKESNISQKAKSGDTNLGDTLLQGCEKPDKNHSQKTEITGKVKAKTGAPNPLPQCDPTKKKNKCKVNNSAETRDKSEVAASVKGCGKIENCHDQKTEITGKVKAKTGAPNPLPQCDPVKKTRSRNKMKTRCKNKTLSQPLIKDSEHFDNSHHNDKIRSAAKTESKTTASNPFAKYGNVENTVPGDELGEFSISVSAFLKESLCSPEFNEIMEGKAFNNGESAGFQESPSSKLNSLRHDSEPDVGLRCRSPDNPTGVDISIDDTGKFRFSGNDERPNSRRDLEMTDRVFENTEDEDGANVSNSSAGSFRNRYFPDGAVTQDNAASPFLNQKQEKTIVGDDTSSKDDNEDKTDSHSGSHVTNRVISLIKKITSKVSVEDTKHINVIDNGGEGGLASPQGQTDLKWNHSRDGFRTENAGALRGVGTEGTNSDSSGSRCVPTNEVIALPHPCIQSVKTEISQGLHGLEGSDHDTKVEQLPSLHAGSSGESVNVRTGIDSGAGVTWDKKRDHPPYLKECVIALAMIITALAF